MFWVFGVSRAPRPPEWSLPPSGRYYTQLALTTKGQMKPTSWQGEFNGIPGRGGRYYQ